MPDESQGAPLVREAVLALVGRELDAAVAEHVMGFKRRWSVYMREDNLYFLCPPGEIFHLKHVNSDATPSADAFNHVPYYSTDRNACQSVIDDICKRRRSLRTRFTDTLQGMVSDALGLDGLIHPSELIFYATPEIICRAALLAVLGHNRGDG